MEVYTQGLADTLINTFGIKKFVGVPCSNLKYLINHLTNIGVYTPMANEGDCVAYAVGQYLVGTKVGILMQNSGFSNALSPILSLAKIYNIPLYMIIGNRGGKDDEPQHYYTRDFVIDSCKSLGYDTCSAYKLFDDNCTFDNGFAVLVNKGTLTKVELVNNKNNNENKTSRSDVLKVIDEFRRNLHNDAAVVTTTGFTSREFYDKYDNNQNFYMVGSMGCASLIGKGIVDGLDKLTIVIDGDGAVLMRPNSLISSYENDNPNLLHIIIDNEHYESTGNQNSPSDMCIENLVHGCISSSSKRVVKTCMSTPELETILNTWDGTYPLTVVVHAYQKGDNDLGRPKETMVELRDRFMKSVKE